jgi:hypothetical protein
MKVDFNTNYTSIYEVTCKTISRTANRSEDLNFSVIPEFRSRDFVIYK